MKNMYFNYFNLAQHQVVMVAGDADNAALVHLLAAETVAAGQRALILSPQTQKYPIEGKVLVSDETELLLTLIRSEQPQVTYLARKVQADLLVPFDGPELLQFAVQIKQYAGEMKLFVPCQAKAEIPDGYRKLLEDALPVCSINFNRLREELLEVYRNTAIRSSNQARKKIRTRFMGLIAENCPPFARSEDKTGHVVYIDQVKNVLDENLLIPVARHLKEENPIKILYGNMHHYQVKEI